MLDGGVVPRNLALLAPPVVGPSGTVYLRDGFTRGVPATGDLGAPDPDAEASAAP